jgi:nucleoid-associated protein YgaU
VVTAEKTETVGTQKTYTVKPGQTLSSIAQEVYGNARFWVAIARENKSIDPKHLKIGEKINLPDVSEVRPGPVLVDVIEPVATSGGSAVDTTGSTYRVQSGDSLYKISKKLFGTGKKATAIYQLNKALIGDDETRLKPGMLLRIPEGARVAVSSAR